jgi:hypothetical protein
MMAFEETTARNKKSKKNYSALTCFSFFFSSLPLPLPLFLLMSARSRLAALAGRLASSLTASCSSSCSAASAAAAAAAGAAPAAAIHGLGAAAGVRSFANPGIRVPVTRNQVRG